MLRSIVLALLLSAFTLSTPAHAVREAGTSRGDALPHRTVLHADRQSALEQGPAWQSFRARYGSWRAMWNEHAGSPELATGPAIALGARADDRESVDRALRGFIASNPGLFRTATRDLETVRVQHAGQVWYASYRRRVDGVPVLFETWEFRVGANGRLMAFGANAEPLPANLTALPVLDAAAAREAARADLGLSAAAQVEGGESLYWLPETAAGATSYHLVRDVRARAASPPASWVALVDATTGAVRWRYDRLRYGVNGTVSGAVHLGLPTDVPQPQGFAHQLVTVGSSTVATSLAGNYSSVSPASGIVTVSAGLTGFFCDVIRLDGPGAAFSTSAQAPGTADISWGDGNSQISERDGYYHVNQIHDHVYLIDPEFAGNNYSMPCVVNINATCNAFWDGSAVNFFRAGGACPNTATMPDVVYHEYGHGVNDNLYIQAGAPFGMMNGALHEGLADVLAAFFQDDPEMGKGMFGPGTILRTLVNANRWPQNGSTDPHVTGLIVGGAMWDLRQTLGLPVAEQLSHFAKYGRPDDADDGLAMSKYFVEVLVADDNDGDLANGTPHSPAIIAAFNAHGIGTGSFLSIQHVALEDRTDPGSVPVVATIANFGPLGGVDATSARVHYSVNGSPFGTVPLVPVGGDNYAASIPGLSSTIVRYYLSAADQFGDTRTVPTNSAEPLVFLVGPTSTLFLHDHESNAGWIPADPSDNATSGRWQWVVPMGSYVGSEPVQTNADHTPTGILCYVTQNPLIDLSPGAHDVDNGHTTLFTSAFDATAAGSDPLIEYYRWYTNGLGSSPGTDLWRVDISNNGGMTWHPVESTTFSDNSWRRVVFFVRDSVEPGTFMRMRFIAEDIGAPSLVEAAVDDLRLLKFDAGVTAVGDAPAVALAFAPPSPNPSPGRTRFAFSLPARGAASLAIFDLSGRRVRGLTAGSFDSGPHDAVWDGRDERGQPVASGLYFARLETAAGTLTRRVARSR